MKSVLVLGSSNIDLVLNTDVLPRVGETVLGNRFYQAAGGKGANQAVAAARAGANVSFAGAVGTDEFGDDAIAGLRREGIDIQFLKRVSGTRSGVAMIIVDGDGHNLIAVAPGANAAVNEEFVDSLPDALFEQAGVFVCQMEIPYDAVRLALRRARQAGATTLLNPAPMDRRIIDDIRLSLVDVLILNEPEATLLSGISIDNSDCNQAAQLLDGLVVLGPSAVVMTLGKRGYFLGDGKQREFVAAHNVRAVDTVAAGDTFVGVLASRLALGAPLAEAARWANAAAALAVTKTGAQPSIPDRAATEAFFWSLQTSKNA